MKRPFPYLKILWRVVYIPLECLVAFLLTFWSIAMILAHIGVSAEETPASQKQYTIYLTFSDVHSDIVMPVKSELIDWTRELDLSDTLLNDSLRTYFAFGWGERNFFLKTRTWADVKVSTVALAASHLGSSAMHVIRREQPDPKNKGVAELRVTKDQYLRIIAFIRSSFKKQNGHVQNIPTDLYGPNDLFFEAERSYGITYTCNSWTNTALKEGGQKACVWTAFPDGIYRQYEGTGNGE